MKIVLIVPPSHTHYVVQPLGLGYLATALRRAGFDDVSILDSLKENLDFDSLQERLLQMQPAVVGFQAYSYDFSLVARSISAIKKKLPDTLTVLGGPHVSATGALAMEELPALDFAFGGEGETGLPLLMKRILQDEEIPYREIPGLIYRESGKVQQVPRAVIEEIDSLGFPAWDLMVPGEYPDSPQGGFYKQFLILKILRKRIKLLQEKL